MLSFTCALQEEPVPVKAAPQPRSPEAAAIAAPFAASAEVEKFACNAMYSSLTDNASRYLP